MILTLGTVLLVDVQLGIHILVGSMLILSAATRISPNFAHRFKVLLEKNGRAYLLILGLVHGASNMGGALITIYAASLFRTKVLIRANIGFA